jgi:hypothetical protein
VAFVAAFAESVAAGVFLGGKRAMAIVHALGVLRLGRSLVRLIFERMLRIDEDGDIGQRGGRIARGIERLPLARAEELLTRAVQAVTGDTAQSGWLRRKVQGRLLNTVGKYTLARFREDAAEHGGIDLLKLKDELEQTVDDALMRRFRGGFRTVTVLVMLGLPLLVAIQTWVILRFCDQTSGNSL